MIIMNRDSMFRTRARSRRFLNFKLRSCDEPERLLGEEEMLMVEMVKMRSRICGSTKS